MRFLIYDVAYFSLTAFIISFCNIWTYLLGTEKLISGSWQISRDIRIYSMMEFVCKFTLIYKYTLFLETQNTDICKVDLLWLQWMRMKVVCVTVSELLQVSPLDVSALWTCQMQRKRNWQQVVPAFSIATILFIKKKLNSDKFDICIYW